VATNPSIKAVVLTAAHTAADILPAFQAGACGFLRQDIPSKQLIKSLELVALGQSVMHPHFQQMALTSPAGPETGVVAITTELIADNDRKQLFPPRLADMRSPEFRAPAGEQQMPGNDVARSLSRRELVILRTLTEGASNKIIARKLVITESTVKVHMKAILRKLRLQNRTQAAIWARTHLGALLENVAA
jgi:two-component system nitrate/nitrite response regulator NarL